MRNLDFKIKLDVTYAKSICNNELSREVIKNTYFQLNSNQPKNIDQKFNAKSYLKDWVISNNNGNGSCTIHVNFKLTYNSLLSKIDYSKFTLVVNNKEQMGSELFAFIW